MEIAERARKNETIILMRLSEVGQSAVAVAVGVSDATVSRFKADWIGLIAKVLAALGLKVVPVDFHCYKPQTIHAIFHLAQERLNEIKTPESLAWDE